MSPYLVMCIECCQVALAILVLFYHGYPEMAVILIRMAMS